MKKLEPDYMHKRNMLDVFFVSMFLLCVLTINVSNVEAAETTVSVQPSSQTVGQEGVPLPTSPFAINITVQDVEDLYAWQIVLYYNSTLLSTRTEDLIIIPPENVFKGKEPIPMGPFIEVDSIGTYILFGASLLGEPSGVTITGLGVLCQITFTGQATGTSELKLGTHTQYDFYTELRNSSSADNPLLPPLPISTVDGKVTVIGIETPREPSAITIDVNPADVAVGSNVTITGTINVTRVGVDVTMYYRPLPGTWDKLATVQTNEFSYYEYNWTTEEKGTYELRAYWPGDADYQEAISNIESVTVKWQSTISLNVYPTTVAAGSSVIINGTIITAEPILPYEMVTIYMWKDGKWTTLATVNPGEDGVYTFTWKTWTPAEGVSYQLKASWPGDGYSWPAESSEQTLEVTVEKLIPTAYLPYIIAAIAIIAIIGIYFIKIRKRQHATDK